MGTVTETIVSEFTRRVGTVSGNAKALTHGSFLEYDDLSTDAFERLRSWDTWMGLKDRVPPHAFAHAYTRMHTHAHKADTWVGVRVYFVFSP